MQSMVPTDRSHRAVVSRTNAGPPPTGQLTFSECKNGPWPSDRGNRFPSGDLINVLPQSPIDVGLVAAPSGARSLNQATTSASSRRVPAA